MDSKTNPPTRLGPRPLPLHLMTAINAWSSSRGALPMLRNDSIDWNPEIAARAAEVDREAEQRGRIDPRGKFLAALHSPRELALKISGNRP